MSDTETFKSSQAEAVITAGAILASAIAGDTSLNITISRTNLSVVNNIRELGAQLSLSNEEFKQLVEDDSDSILNLAEFFSDFDTGMSGDMEIR